MIFDFVFNHFMVGEGFFVPNEKCYFIKNRKKYKNAKKDDVVNVCFNTYTDDILFKNCKILEKQKKFLKVKIV